MGQQHFGGQDGRGRRGRGRGRGSRRGPYGRGQQYGGHVGAFIGHGQGQPGFAQPPLIRHPMVPCIPPLL
jgi:hypothetical protein